MNRSSPPAYTLRTVRPDDVGELLRLYNALFPNTNKTAAWWQWWYGENPAGASFQVTAESMDGSLLGMLGMTPVRLWCGGSEVRVAQDSVGIVRPDSQRQGVFSAMVTELHRLEAQHYPFNFCFCNEKSCRAYVDKVGSAERSIGAFFEKEPAMPPRHPALRPIKRFGLEHDGLWRAIRDRLQVAQVRDARYLNWRFAKARTGNRYWLYDVRDGHDALCGYVVLQPFRGKLDLLDYCLLEGAGLGDTGVVLDILESVGSEHAFERVSFWALDVHHELLETLAQRGYRRAERSFHLLSRQFWPDPHYCNLADFGRWCYTAGDMELF